VPRPARSNAVRTELLAEASGKLVSETLVRRLRAAYRAAAKVEELEYQVATLYFRRNGYVWLPTALERPTQPKLARVTEVELTEDFPRDRDRLLNLQLGDSATLARRSQDQRVEEPAIAGQT